jgi:hypothetical protein
MSQGHVSLCKVPLLARKRRFNILEKDSEIKPWVQKVGPFQAKPLDHILDGAD